MDVGPELGSLIVLSNVDFSYRSPAPAEQGGEGLAFALRGINADIPAGQFLSLIGPNGSGKSTLARLLNGLLLPTRGSVKVAGLDTRDPGAIWEIRRRVGMVFQNPDNQLVAPTVEEDVAFGPENLGIPQPELGRRVWEALEAVGMSAYAKAETHTLSGGQKQRVAIAGVLAMQPEVLVLDEPTALLDPVGRQEVISTVIRLHRQLGITVVWITHSMEEAVLAERVWLLADGRLVMDAPPARIFAEAEWLRRLRLDVPAVVTIAARLREAGFAIPPTVLTGEELVRALMQGWTGCMQNK